MCHSSTLQLIDQVPAVEKGVPFGHRIDHQARPADCLDGNLLPVQSKKISSDIRVIGVGVLVRFRARCDGEERAVYSH